MAITVEELWRTLEQHPRAALLEGKVQIDFESPDLGNDVGMLFRPWENGWLWANAVVIGRLVPESKWAAAVSACNAWNFETVSTAAACLFLANDGSARIQLNGSLSVGSGMSPAVEEFCRVFPGNAIQALSFIHVEHNI